MKVEVSSCESGELKFGCENEGRDRPSDSICEVSETGSSTLLFPGKPHHCLHIHTAGLLFETLAAPTP